jgi:hypothetical protein
MRLSAASPSVNLHPWSADLEKNFVSNPDNIRDLGAKVGSVEEARATLRALSNYPIGAPVPPASAPLQDRWGRPLTAAGTIKTPNSRSWTAEEEKQLKEVVGECVAEGLSGEPLWRAAHPRLLARGVNRAMGGMKMRWCRGLREETQIDERRKKNSNKMISALQGPKGSRNSDTHGKGKSGAWADQNFASTADRNSTFDTTAGPSTAPLRSSGRASNRTSTTYVDMTDADEEFELDEEDETSDDEVPKPARGVHIGARPRARSF